MRRDPIKEKRYKRWSWLEIERLKSLYYKNTNFYLSNLLNRTIPAIVSKAQELELKKNSKHISDTNKRSAERRWRNAA